MSEFTSINEQNCDLAQIWRNTVWQEGVQEVPADDKGGIGVTAVAFKVHGN